MKILGNPSPFHRGRLRCCYTINASPAHQSFRITGFNTYASQAFNLIAWECKETGEFHTCDDGMIVEVLKDGRPAAMGERARWWEQTFILLRCPHSIPAR